MSDQVPPPQATEAGLAAANLPDGPHPATPHLEVPAGGSGIPIDPALEGASAPEAAAAAAPAAEMTVITTSNDVTMTDAAVCYFSLSPLGPVLPSLLSHSYFYASQINTKFLSD